VRPASLPLTTRSVRASARPVPLAVALAVALAGCALGEAPPTPPVTPGTGTSPREVNVVMKDYEYIPAVLDLVPGETVLFHFVNGGLAVHEAIIGDMPIQRAWEEAEAAHAEPPPGPTPVVAVPAGMEGFRVVVESGERKDVRWTVPTEVAAPLILGCHIPGHWARGMRAPIRLAEPGGSPAPATSTLAPASVAPDGSTSPTRP
jgi:uncharacterized cupredoxin-like copper-binding protein